MSREVFQLAGIRPANDSMELFERLCREAEQGDLVGSIVVAMYRPRACGHRYFLSMTGWASNSPTFAAGAMSACQVLVQELALQEAGLIQ